MAFTELEKKKYGKLMADFVGKRRPPQEIRDKVDLAYRIERQSIVIFEIRPLMFDSGRKIESPIAKTTFVRTQKIWNVYWMRRDLKWHSYPLQSRVRSLARFLELVDDDAMCCFWG
ncbi:MAG: DUF3024 domain-containing protein [candidate division Zixibacteria bacterium]|nr:DUF3024 domain-containing protein [candidate division Zixibacteria bacterium]